VSGAATQPGDVIVIDNASFHHSQTIEKLWQQRDVNCGICPYSPDLDEIEHWWFVLKNWMRSNAGMTFDSFRDCVDAAFNKSFPNITHA